MTIQNDDRLLTKSEKEDKNNQEIVDMYAKREDGSPQVKQGKKSLFDELWEKKNPEAAQQLQEEQEQSLQQLSEQNQTRNETEPKVEEQPVNQTEPIQNKTEEQKAPPVNETKPVPVAKPVDPEKEWRRLVDEANKDDPWKEPIKDLIDKYADIAENNR